MGTRSGSGEAPASREAEEHTRHHRDRTPKAAKSADWQATAAAASHGSALKGVEAPGVEPGSKGTLTEASTSVVRVLVLRCRTSADQIPQRYPDFVPGGPRARADGQVGLGDALTPPSNPEEAGRATD